jgi:hypothetical protein
MTLKRGMIQAALAVAGLFAASGTARAGFGNFTYTVGTISPASPWTSGDVSITITPFVTNQVLNASGAGTDITIATANVVDNTTVANGSSVTTNISIPYSFQVIVTDQASGVSSSPNYLITGTLGGSVTKSVSSTGMVSESYNLTNVYNAVLPNNLNLGGTIYTVSFTSQNFFAPAPSGSFGLHLTADPVPEPSAVFLAAIGVTGLWGMYYRGRRKA